MPEALQSKLLTMTTWGSRTDGRNARQMSCNLAGVAVRARAHARLKARLQGSAAMHLVGAVSSRPFTHHEVLHLRDRAIYGSQPFTLEARETGASHRVWQPAS